VRWWSTDEDAPGPWIGLALLTPLFLLPNFGYYHDGVMNASYVVYGEWLTRIHPHHLGYNTAILAIWYAIGAFGIAVHPLGIMATVSRIATLIVLWRSWRLSRSMGLSGGWSTIGQFLLGLSFATWAYGTNAAVYLPTLVCLLALVRIALSWIAEAPTPRTVWIGVAWLIGAVLLHELAVFAAFPMAWWCWRRAKAHAIAPWPLLRIALIGTTVPLVLAYTIGFLVAFDGGAQATPESIGRWLFRYGRQRHYWVWNRAEEDRTALQVGWQQSVEGNGRMLMASPIGERFDPITDSGFARTIQEAWPRERLLSLWYVLLPLSMLLTIAGATLLARRDADSNLAVCFCVVWIALFVAFCTSFEPQNAFYRLYYWPIAIPLILTVFASIPGRLGQFIAYAICGVALVGLGSINAGYGYIPRKEASCNPALATIMSLDQLPAGALVFSTWGDGFEDFHLARLLIQDRPIYKLGWYTREEYAVSNFGTVPLEDRLSQGRADFDRLALPLLVSQGRAASGMPQMSVERPILRLCELQTGRPEAPEIWLDFTALAVTATHQAGEYEVWELQDAMALR